MVWRALRRLGVPERDLPDAAQDVFVVVHRRLGEFDGGSRVSTWLYAICLRVASDRRRRAPQRTVFVSFELEGMTGDEIAEVTGVPLATVHSRLRLSRETFRRVVARARAREEFDLGRMGEKP